MRKRYSSKRPQGKLLSHRKHTGKLLPAKHTSYPILVFMLLLVGVWLVGLTLPVAAGDVKVTAEVQGNPPTQAAVITNPLDGTHFKTSPITVSGTCTPGDAVEIYDNNAFKGSTLCNSNGTFSLQVDLFPGTNQLQARIFNLGNNEGPRSAIVTVYLDGPLSAPSNSSTGSTSAANATGQTLLLQTNLYYVGYYVNDTVIWKLSISGGTAPYAVAVDWGDGNTSVLSETQAGTFEIRHVYRQPGGYHGNYPIKLKGSDATGQNAFLQLFVLINNNNRVNSVLSAGGTNLTPANPLKIIWLAYLIILLMVTSFWLGERRGIQIIKKRLKPTSLRPRRT